MPELEHALNRLASQLDWPPTPAPIFRLEPRRRRPARPLAVALAAALLAVAIAFSVTPARSAILRLFHLGGVTVHRVTVLPPAPELPLSARLGPEVSEHAARAALGVPVQLPPLDRTPPLHLSHGVVSVLLPGPHPVLLSELRSDSYLLKKIAMTSTRVAWLQVGGAPGLWISGRQHVVVFPSTPARLAGNVLVWYLEGTTFRLEGRGLSKQRALQLVTQIMGT